MDILFLLQSIVTLSAFFLVIYKLWITGRAGLARKSQAIKLPEPPGAWPLIGHLPLLGGKLPVFRTLGAIADEHGPIFKIRFGTKRAVVVSSWEIMREVLATNHLVWLNRPSSGASSHLAYGPALFGFSSYGPYWREVRKVVSLELLSNRGLDLFAGVRASEVGTAINELHSLCTNSAAKVDMSEWFSSLAMNTTIRMMSGKRYSAVKGRNDCDEEFRRFGEAIDEFLHLAGSFLVSDFVPCTEWLDLGGTLKRMKRNAEVLDQIMSGWVEEHRLSGGGSGGDGLREERDVIDALLSLVGGDVDSMYHGQKSEIVVKGTVLNLVVGSVDTTSVTLTWALSLLVNHSQVLRRAQEELDLQIGRESWVQESDTKKLVYLQAIIMETMRLYPAGPLIAREAIEDCRLAGYNLPKGTMLFLNFWRLHRDSRIWQEPDEFKPERFLSAHVDVDVRGKQFEYLPFSSGRRACPGNSLAMRMLFLTLARVLQGFNITTPTNEPVDMREGLSLTLPKVTPLEVILSPRLSDELYRNNIS